MTIKLAGDFLDRGRTIIADNFFTSSKLGKALWERKTHLLGTIRARREGNPGNFIKEQAHQVSLFFKFINLSNLGW